MQEAIENVGAFEQFALFRLHDILVLLVVLGMDDVDDFLEQVLLLDVHLDDVAPVVLDHEQVQILEDVVRQQVVLLRVLEDVLQRVDVHLPEVLLFLVPFERRVAGIEGTLQDHLLEGVDHRLHFFRYLVSGAFVDIPTIHRWNILFNFHLFNLLL